MLVRSALVSVHVTVIQRNEISAQETVTGRNSKLEYISYMSERMGFQHQFR